MSAAGTRRRLQALAVTGWAAAILAERSGVAHRSVVQITSEQVERVRASTADAVATLYARLAGSPGTSVMAAKVRTDAARRGWVHPDRWEGVDIDDPAAGPAPAEVARADRSRVHVDDVEHFARCGDSWDLVASRLGVSAGAVERAVLRAGRRDVVDRLVRNSAGRWAA